MKYLITTILFLLFCFVPYWTKLELITPFKDNSELLRAFESTDLRLIITGCISTSVPIFLDIFRDFLTTSRRLTSYITDIGSSMIILVVIISNIAFLYYVLPHKDIRLFVTIDGCRVMAIYGCLLFYIFRVSAVSWKSIHPWTLLLLGLSGFAIQIWAPYIYNSIHFAGDCLIYIAIVLFAWKGCGIFCKQYQRWKSKERMIKIPMNEYSCNVYILMTLLFLCLTMILRSCTGLSGNYVLNSKYIIGQNIICTSLYILISIFEREIVIQENVIQVSI